MRMHIVKSPRPSQTTQTPLKASEVFIITLKGKPICCVTEEPLIASVISSLSRRSNVPIDQFVCTQTPVINHG